MPELELKSTLSELIKNSSALDAPKRDLLLQHMDILAEPQVQQLTTLLQQEQMQLSTIDAKYQEQELQVKTTFSDAVRKFERQAIPRAYRKVEVKDHAEEEKTLEKLLEEVARIESPASAKKHNAMKPAKTMLLLLFLLAASIAILFLRLSHII